MRKKDLQVLEYQKVMQFIIEKAQTSIGKEIIESLRPTNDFDIANTMQKETEEAKQILNKKGNIAFAGIRDIRVQLRRAQMQGVLNEEECLNVSGTLRGTRIIKKFINDYWQNICKNITPEYTAIYLYYAPLTEHVHLEKAIDICIDDNGLVKDTASTVLLQIRRQLHTISQRAKQKLDEIIRNSNNQKMLQDVIITTRNDRYVIPVKQEYRSFFGGIIHDQSASGATLFIEPQAVVELNNKQRELEIKEKNEIDRILKELTEQIALSASEIFINVKNLGILDSIFAKAQYAIDCKGVYPTLNNKGIIKAIKARHPLIPANEVVPIDIRLGETYNSIIITGPNTGGKTVTLKTIGLMTLLACSGIQPTTEEECQFAVFDGIYADIGDEQSIEQSLSTFSGHMTNIIEIFKIATSDSLILLDELGAGTDPQEGAALAMSLLTYLQEKNITTVATTHYSELKSFAFNTPKMVNASVEFDVGSLRPTYKLQIGVPGKSNALAIAKRLGLDQRHISLAETYLSNEEKDVNALLENLELTRRELERERDKIDKTISELEIERNKLSKKYSEFEIYKDNKLRELEQQAKLEIAKTKQEAENMIQELRKLNNENITLKEHVLIEKKRQLDQLSEIKFTQNNTFDTLDDQKLSELLPGDDVQIKSLRQKGNIIQKISDTEYLVNVGIMKVTLKRSDLQKIKAKPIIQNKQIIRIQKEVADIKMELDLRGKTIDEAIYEIEQYIDKAILAGLHEVSIIHGKGTGALRAGVQDYVKYHPRIKSYRYGQANEGGIGVTIINI